MTAGGVRIPIVAVGIVALVCGAWIKSGVYRTPCPEELCTSRSGQRMSPDFIDKPPCTSYLYEHDRWKQEVQIQNQCRYSVTFAVLTAGPDSPCLLLKPNEFNSWRWSRLLGWEGVRFGCEEDS